MPDCSVQRSLSRPDSPLHAAVLRANLIGPLTETLVTKWLLHLSKLVLQRPCRMDAYGSGTLVASHPPVAVSIGSFHALLVKIGAALKSPALATAHACTGGGSGENRSDSTKSQRG